MKKEDKVYLMEQKAVQSLKEKYGLEVRPYEFISIDLYNDGHNLACFYEKEKGALYYVQVYMMKNEAKIYSAEKYVRWCDNENKSD